MSFTQREARALIRKAVNRVPEGESIRHLNIMPMMDMMTILLVAFIFQMATSALELTAGTVTLPATAVDSIVAEKTWILVITPVGIVIEGGNQAAQIVSVHDGDVDASEKEGGQLGLKITRLTQFLASLHQQEAAAAIRSGGDPNAQQEMLVIADRTIPYRLLVEVMYSANRKEAGYNHFRLIVQKSFPAKPNK